MIDFFECPKCNRKIVDKGESVQVHLDNCMNDTLEEVSE